MLFNCVSQPLDAAKSQLPKPVVQLPSEQVPVEQLSVAFVSAQAALHAPQCVSEVSATSQPLFTSPSQSPKPAAHATRAQLPDEQVVVAFACAQVVLHPPQFWLVLVAVSQPFRALPSQSLKPVLHAVIAQVPVAHDTLALGRLHAVPQAPQLAVVRNDVSQPFCAAPSQLAKFALQVPTAQLAVLQLAVALGSCPFVSPQRALHAPQCASELRLCSQVVPSPSQSALPLGQAANEQTPPEHVRLSLAPQMEPHTPQLASVSSVVSQPSLRPLFGMLLLQLPKPGWHAVNVQVPVAHDALALGYAHAMPQPPQSVSVRVDVSQPLLASLSQSANPAVQLVTTQSPATQAKPPTPPGSHTRPQAPQLFGSVLREPSHSLSGSLSQSL